jgi:uncharacterized protein involved in outer membrane biogenesis
VYFFEWNMLRGPIAKRVEQATGRSFAINGDLHVHLSRTPRITADGLVFGNAPWAKEPTMAEIGRLDFTIDPFALWRGRVVLPELSLTDARLNLEKNSDGAANWTLDTQKKDSRPPPAIGALAIERTHITYRDPAIKTDFATDASTVPSGEPDAGMLKLAGRGTIKGLQGTVDGVIGSVLTLSSAERPYPIRLKATVGSTRARVDGTLLDPLHLKSEDVNFHL